MYRLDYTTISNSVTKYKNEIGSANDQNSLYSTISKNLDQVFFNVHNSKLAKGRKQKYKDYVSFIKNNLFDILNMSFDRMKMVVEKQLQKSDPFYILCDPDIDLTKKISCNVIDPQTGKNILYKSGKKKGKVKKENRKFHEIIVDAMKYDCVRGIMCSCFQERSINACVYCNAQYLLTYKHEKKVMSTMQIDHYFDKAEWPCFSSSFFNFQPSCGYCNQKKSKNSVLFYLYTSKPDEKDPFRFEIPASELAAFLIDYSKEISLKFGESATEFKTMADNHNKIFHISELYNSNFLEIIKKFIKRKKFLYKILNHYRNSFKIEESILKMSYNEIYFDFIDDSEKIHTEPLTKLKQDINDQVEPLIAGIYSP